MMGNDGPGGDRYPRWLVPALLGGLALVGMLGMTGALRNERQIDCEEAGGRWVMGYGSSSACLFPEDETR